MFHRLSTTMSFANSVKISGLHMGIDADGNLALTNSSAHLAETRSKKSRAHSTDYPNHVEDFPETTIIVRDIKLNVFGSTRLSCHNRQMFSCNMHTPFCSEICHLWSPNFTTTSISVCKSFKQKSLNTVDQNF